MNPIRRRHGLLALTFALLPMAGCAGPLLDSLRERRAAAGESSEGELSGVFSGRLKGDVPMPAGARLIRDVKFGDDPQQTLDVYVPANARGAPILFMVHGGAWMLGDKAYLPVVKAKVQRWLPKGYIVVSTNYRMSRNPKVLDQVDDVARALALTQQQAATWGGDAGRLLVMGHSAGAHLVSLLASDQALIRRHGLQPWRGTVSLDSAVLNVVETMESKHYGFYDRVFGDDRDLWLAASPFHRLGTVTAPFLLVCASGRPDSCPQAEAFAGKLRSLGGKATVLPVAMKHGATNTELGEPSAYTESVERFMHEVGLP
ncbi:MAG: alpha/beta hydrolase [Burkholderiaceae bacterium]|nr:alpha/beta hydrolase [Burkholderiaceae bacterium]